jgi:HSP20 family protein
MANLQVYKPFRDLWSLPDEIGRLFWGLSRFEPEFDVEAPIGWAPAVDVAEDQEAMHVRAELPGLKKDQVKINIREGVLTLSGERKFEDEKKRDNYYRIERSYGSFARSFTLPTTVDVEKIQATMRDGVLELTIPKKPEAKAKEIKVEVS